MNCAPEEILLGIIDFACGHSDPKESLRTRMRIGGVCRQFHRISLDHTLSRTIPLRGDNDSDWDLIDINDDLFDLVECRWFDTASVYEVGSYENEYCARINRNKS